MAGPGRAPRSVRRVRAASVIGNDVLHGPQTAPWQAIARLHGIRGSTGRANRNDGQVVGVRGVSSGTSGDFGRQDAARPEDLAAGLPRTGPVVRAGFRGPRRVADTRRQ